MVMRTKKKGSRRKAPMRKRIQKRTQKRMKRTMMKMSPQRTSTLRERNPQYQNQIILSSKP